MDLKVGSLHLSGKLLFSDIRIKKCYSLTVLDKKDIFKTRSVSSSYA